MARTTFHGNYDGLPSAWEQFHAWLDSNGHTPAADFWECYTAGPETSPDPAQWRTQLNRLLRA